MPRKGIEARREYDRIRYATKKHLWLDADGRFRRLSDDALVVHNARARTKWNSDADYRASVNRKRKEKRAASRTIGTCPICGIVQPAWGLMSEGQLVRDHCHRTTVTRGWICVRCNLALGHAMDSPGILRKMADYLENFMALQDGNCDQ